MRKRIDGLVMMGTRIMGTHREVATGKQVFVPVIITDVKHNNGTMYKTILIDPPWQHAAGGSRGADKKYPLMKMEEILALPIQKLAHPDGAHLYLWTINNSMQDAFKCLEAWEFDYVTMITWMKSGKPGIGQYFRGITEHCLFATTKKKLPYKIIDSRRQQGVTGFMAERREHSAKPEQMRMMIERVSYPPYVELFARRLVNGWTVCGNEVNRTLQSVLRGECADYHPTLFDESKLTKAIS